MSLSAKLEILSLGLLTINNIASHQPQSKWYH